jgi:hypothetical protein
MSTLNVSNITDGTDTVGTSYVVNGSAKAWANYAHLAGLNDSFNFSTFIDNGQGDYSLSLASSFSTANYAVGSTCRSGGGRTNVLDSASTASVIRTNLYVTSSGATTDGDATLIAHGDLA